MNLVVSCLGILLFANTFGQKDPIVLKINDEGIPQSEFLYIYTKNNPTPSFQDDSLDDYMQLFINYKLKVMEAREKKYDTIPRLVTELKQYRDQLSIPYMIDQEKNEELIKEAYDRTVNEVRAAHILVRANVNATPEDTVRAYKKIMKLRDRIIAGEDFNKIAEIASEDPSAKTNKGNLGFFSAFQMVYPFEEAAFNLAPGEVSMPIRTQFGYHLVKTFEKRKAAGKMKAAHILILANDEMSKEDQEKAKSKVDEIYKFLQDGQSFEELAAKYSDDKTSRNKGGMLPVFGAGAKQRMVPEFEEAAFKLEKDGDYTAPVQSMYGWHIIKRHELTPVGSFEELKRELKLRVERDARATKMQEAFLEQLKADYNFKADKSTELVAYLTQKMDSTIWMGRWKGIGEDAKKSETLFSFADLTYTLGDFEKHLIDHQRKRMETMTIPELINSYYDDYVTEELKKYEDSQLEAKHPAFKSLMQEYRDGILVFEIMQDEVWNKASRDTTGVKAYYEAHKSDFTFPTRYKGVMYRCRTKEIANEVVALINTDTLKYGEIQKQVNGESNLNCRAKQHIFNSETTDAFKTEKKGKVVILTFKEGLNKTFEHNGEWIVFDVEEVQAPRNREFNEAKGLVTAAYQNQLEKEWLESLRKKYNIEIQTEALHAIESAE